MKIKDLFNFYFLSIAFECDCHINIFLEFFVEDADNVKFITEMLTKPSPMFKVEWTKNNATMNSCFPFEP